MKFKINKNVLWKVVDNEVVLVNSKNDEYSYLNTTGAEVWQMIAEGVSQSEIVKKLSGEYDTSPETIKKDIDAIIDDLIKSKLIAKHSA